MPTVCGASLCFRLARVSFPEDVLELAPTIRFRLDNYNTESAPDAVTDPDPDPGVRRVPVLATDPVTGKVVVTTDHPPSMGVAPTPSPYPAAAVDGLPRAERLELAPPRPEEERRRRRPRNEVTAVAATGHPGRGGPAVAALVHVGTPVANGPRGFPAVVPALDALCRAGKVDSWMPTMPAEAPWKMIDGVEAWSLPFEVGGRLRRFAVLGPGRVRGCLVAEVTAPGGTIHLLGLERRLSAGSPGSGERFCFVLLGPPPGALEDIVGRLFQGVVERNGVWPTVADGARRLRLRHHYGSAPDATATGKGVAVDWLAGEIAGFIASAS